MFRLKFEGALISFIEVGVGELKEAFPFLLLLKNEVKDSMAEI